MECGRASNRLLGRHLLACDARARASDRVSSVTAAETFTTTAPLDDLFMVMVMQITAWQLSVAALRWELGGCLDGLDRRAGSRGKSG